MRNFEYFNPVKIIYGPGEVGRLGKIVKDYGKKALIVSYREINFFGDLFDRIHNALVAEGITYVDCLEATANPKISEAERGISLGKKEDVDVVIGVGGGSAMDLSKIISAGILYPYDDIKRMIKFTHQDQSYQIPPTRALPLILLPTLPATASEMNPTAVITDEISNRKSYVWEPSCLYAKVSILDPTLTLTLPKYQTACGGIDAMSHVVEPFLFSNEETFGNLSLHNHMQLGVIRTIYENIPNVLNTPNDIELRGLMQFAATVGLNGWLTCGVQGWTPMHQMGHVLSSHYQATHGATLACMMLAWMRYFATRDHNERFKLFAKEIFSTEDVLLAANVFEEYLKKIDVQTRISQFGCGFDDLETLTQGVVDVSFSADGTLASIPPITRDEVKVIYELAL